MVLQGKPNSTTKTNLSYDRTKFLKKSKSMPPQLNDSTRSANGSSLTTLKIRIKGSDPIDKSRKKYNRVNSLASKQVEVDPDFQWIFDNVSQDDTLWLSSEILSPLYNDGDSKLTSCFDSNDVHDELDLDEMQDLDEPLNWPFGDKLVWSSTWELFNQSPRKGLYATSNAILSKNDVGSKSHSKNLWKRRVVVASGLSASKIVEFKRGTRRIAIASRNTKGMSRGSKDKLKKGNFVISTKRRRTMSQHLAHSCTSSMDFDNSGWSISLINLNGEDSQWISEVESDMEQELDSNFPSPSYKNQVTDTKAYFEDQVSLEILSESTNWDQMDADEPLFWPYGKDQNWSMELDSFEVSPRKGIVGIVTRNNASIRARIHGQRAGFKRRLIVGVSSLSASKIIEFKRKKGNARRIKATSSRFGRLAKRDLAQKMDAIIDNESMLGFCEFDGHEGIDMEFQTDNFSILEE